MELSLNRLVNLIKRDIGIYWQNYIKILLVIIAVHAFSNYTEFGFYWIIITAIFAFKEYNDAAKQKIQIFTLPASNLEKYSYSLFITVIFIPLIIISSMYIGLLLRYVFDIVVFGKEFSQALNLLPSIWEKIINQSIYYIPIISILFFGNIYFKKQGALKLILYMFAFFFIVTMINAYVIYLLKGESHYFITNNFILLPEYTKYIVSSIISIFFLLLSYLRITEKEV